MYNIGLPYQVFIVFCSFLLIFSFIFFLQEYRKAAPFILILFLYETANIENYIRWYLGISFFLFFLSFLNRSKYIYSAVFAIIACAFHVGILPLILILLLFFKIRYNIFHPLVVQTLFVLSLYLGSIKILGFLNPYISILGVDDKASSYTDKFGQLINGDYGLIGIRDALRWSTQIRKLLAYSFPIYFVPLLLKKKRIHFLDANLFNIGIIIAPIFGQVEILDRYGSAFLIFSITNPFLPI